GLGAFRLSDRLVDNDVITHTHLEAAEAQPVDVAQHTFNLEPVKILEAREPPKTLAAFVGLQLGIEGVERITVRLVKADAVVLNHETINGRYAVDHIHLSAADDGDADKPARRL